MVNKMQELLNKVNKSDMNDINIYLFSKPRKKENFEVFSTIIEDNEIKKDNIVFKLYGTNYTIFYSM